MADMITRCPKCGTAFRISDALLKSAKGVVRCGSCLSVFNARDHLEVGRQASPAPRSQPQSDTAQPTARFSETPVQPQQPRPSEPPAREETFAEQEDDEVNTPDWRRREDTEGPKSASSQPEQKPAEEEEDDEAWALELLKDDDDDLNIQFKKIIPKPAPPPEPEPPAPVRDEEPAPVHVEEDEDETIPSAPAPDFSALDEDPLIEDEPVVADEDEPVQAFAPNDVDEPIENFVDEDEPEEAENHSDEAAEEAQDAEVEEQEEILAAAPPPEPPKRKPIRPKLEPKPLKDVIASLEPEPLEVDWQEPGAWRRRLLWPALALVALVCLLAQVAWLEFDRLSRVEPYRSAYAVVCRYVGCQLPELRDRSQIHTSNLLVRSHPDIADALQVDVILQNNAPFEQTFPVLELTFTNLRSEPVASRRLTPAEYLGGELAGRDKMPVRQPIHIALEIADPGRDAVSYHITIVN